MSHHPVRLITLVSLFLAAGLSAARAAEPVFVKFRAVCFDPRETALPEFYIGGGKGARQLLDLDKTRLSDPQEAPVRTGRVVDFFLTKEPRKNEKPALSVTLPENLPDRILMVFAPSGTSYQAWVIPLPPNEFPAGGTLLVNVAPVELAVRAGGGKAVSVAPSKHRFLRTPDGLKDDMMPIQIYQKPANGGEWQIAQSTRWAVDFRFRSYVFFYQPAGGRLMLHGLTERMESSETTAN